MGDSLLGGKRPEILDRLIKQVRTTEKLFEWKKQAVSILKHNNFLLGLLVILVVISAFRIWDLQPKFYAHAYNQIDESAKLKAIIVAGQPVDLIKTKQPIAEINASFENQQQNQRFRLMEQKIYNVVGETPIAEMAPYIAQREEKVAAFLVGIAKKESSWGLASPSKDGQTCYNYWGYKSSGSKGTSMGYACFGSPQEAVEVVGNRLQNLVIDKKLDTPAKLIVWKCGSTCKGHDPAGVAKWVSDVNQYFGKIVQK